MELTLDTPQRVAIVVEKNKADTWSVSAYLVTVDGRRERRQLGVFETHDEAAKGLKRSWQYASLGPRDAPTEC
ncbi:MAG: hypothetical protein QNJ67_21615 [Kiloniellales bacterium]|nr:hypothetical protein [Kiloniellales bacterium]